MSSGLSGAQILNTVDFDGSSYINIADSASLDVSTGFSVSFWAYNDVFNGSDWISKFESSGNQRSFIVKQTSNNIRYRISANGVSTAITLDSNTSLSTATWCHIVCTYDGTDMYIYIDGTEDATTSYSSDIFQGTSNLRLGSTSGANFYNGSMTMPIFSDRAFTPSEVTTLYNLGKPLFYSSLPTGITDDAICALEMTSNDFTLNDLSGNSNNGTNNGTTATGALLEFI